MDGDDRALELFENAFSELDADLSVPEICGFLDALPGVGRFVDGEGQIRLLCQGRQVELCLQGSLARERLLDAADPAVDRGAVLLDQLEEGSQRVYALEAFVGVEVNLDVSVLAVVEDALDQEEASQVVLFVPRDLDLEFPDFRPGKPVDEVVGPSVFDAGRLGSRDQHVFVRAGVKHSE